MKNKLYDLNNYLFAEIERLDDEMLDNEELEKELRRAKGVSNIAQQITNITALQLKAIQLQCEYGPENANTEKLLNGE